MLNALSFIAIIVAVWWWKGEKHQENTLPAESVVAAMISGLRYARYSPALIKTIIRAAAFFVFASAYWAMLPLVARVSLQGDATLYGILTTSIGIGAVARAFSLSALRARFSTGILVTAGTAGTVIVLVIFAVTTSKYLAIAGSIIAVQLADHALHADGVSADSTAGLGQSERAGAVSDGILGVNGTGVINLGADCLTHINNNRAACGGSRYYCCLVMCAESEN